MPPADGIELKQCAQRERLVPAPEDQPAHGAEQLSKRGRDLASQLHPLDPLEWRAAGAAIDGGSGAFHWRCRCPLGLLPPEPLCRGIPGTVRRTAFANPAPRIIRRSAYECGY